MTKIYVAASFAYADKHKSEQRKKEIEEVVDSIRQLNDSFVFFLPHQLHIPNAWNMDLKEWSTMVYENDIKGLEESDVVLFISYGKENNAGSIWEAGYAFAKNKPVIMVKMTEEVESLMIFGSARAIIMRGEIQSYDWNNLPAYITPLNKLS